MFSRICQLSLLLSGTILFIGCSGGGGSPTYNPDIGPFDEDGNYVEAWADNPPKRGSNKRVTQTKSTPKPVTKPVVKPVSKPAPRIVSRPAPAPKPVAQPRPVTVAKVTPIPQPKPVVKPTPQPKPAPVVATPKTIRHVVKRGDTLYGLSKRYGVSISAIKRANGISGTTIQTGKAYTIPR